MRNFAMSQSRAVPAQPGGYQIPFPYYSSVIFRATAGEDTGYGYTFAQGIERKAFSYAEGQEWTQAGATTLLDGRATFCETNLAKPNETNAGESVEITGIAVQVQPAITDGLRFMQSRLLAQIATNVSVHLSLNGGQNAYKLGTIGQLPGAGGIVGVGNDDLSFKVAALLDDPKFPFAQNGWALRSNFFRVPSGLVWRPGNQTDGMLQVIFRTEREFTLYAGGDPENAQNDLGVGEKVHPSYLACVLKVHLIGNASAVRSSVA